MDKDVRYFENKGNAISNEEIKSRVNHPGGKWHPEYDHTAKSEPPVKRSKE